MPIEGCSPYWSDRVWLAQGERSRFWPVIKAFLQAIEANARSASAAERKRMRRRHGVGPSDMTGLRARRLFTAAFKSGRRRARAERRLRRAEALLQDIDAFVGLSLMEAGELSRAMQECGSDKWGDVHNYTLFYEHLFGAERSRFSRVFELGLGTNNVEVPSNMGPNGVPGASLRAWRAYFENAAIFGADIDERILFKEERIETAYVDQRDPAAVRRLFERFGGDFDLIVDDGLHEASANRTFFEGAFERVRPGGIYVVEDLWRSERERFKAFLTPYDAAILDIPHQYTRDVNCLALVARG